MKRLYQFCDLDDERGDRLRTAITAVLFFFVMAAALGGYLQ